MHPNLTCVPKCLEGPIPFKLRNFEPQGGECAFEELSSWLVTKWASPLQLSIPAKSVLWNLIRDRKVSTKAFWVFCNVMGYNTNVFSHTRVIFGLPTWLNGAATFSGENILVLVLLWQVFKHYLSLASLSIFLLILAALCEETCHSAGYQTHLRQW